MATKPLPAILPSNPRDPTGVDRLERGAMRQLDRRMRRVARVYREALERIPVEPAVNRRYDFRLDITLFRALMDQIDFEIQAILLEGGEDGLWLFEQYVEVAAIRGTAQEFANLAQQSPAYKSGRDSVQSILRSEPHMRRMAMARSRVFEEMEKLSAEVKADMGRILTEGIGRGQNPREVARKLSDQAKIESRRAHRIARTEITSALRRARWDEAQEAQDEYGLRTMEMHISALSPTTRASHAARHGKLYTIEQVRDWWAQDANSINCYVPGTKVRGRFVAGSKAEYRGPVVKVVTAGGRSLTVTPNHPILTSKGMVPAAEIREGDYAVAYRVETENLAGVGSLDDQVVEPSIEEVFSALVQVGHSIPSRVDAVDFHGDAAYMNKNIHVVRADRKLIIRCVPALGEVLDDLALIHSNANMAHVGRTPLFGDIGVNLSASCAEGWRSNSATFGGGRSLVSVEGTCPPISDCDVVLQQAAPDHAARHADGFGNSLFGLTSNVTLDKVLAVDVFELRGHVYDLEEKSGLMVANGIIASNCKCSTTSVMVDKNGKPVVPGIVARTKQTKQKMEARDYAWAKE